MNLGFANPALLWGLLAAAIPIAIHLFFRRRPRPTPFPAIDFILRARRETERRLRLRKLLLFAARTLVLAAIAAAIARPRLEEPAAAAAPVPRGPRATAIVLDASGSMRYRLGGKALFERARADALGALASLSAEEPATAVVCGGADPQVAAPSFDRAEVRQVLERAEAEAGFADVTACLSAAARALSGATAQASLGKRIVIATDLAASAWRLDVAPPEVETPSGRVRPEVTVLDAARGAPLPNSAVVAAEAEPDPGAGPRGYRITAQAANYSDQPLAEATLSLVVGTGKEARTAIRAFADLPAGGTVRKTFSHAFSQGGPAVLQVTLPGDALAEDDARALAVVVPREVRALVVDGAPSPVRYRDEAYFVESALASPASPVRPTLVDAEALAAQDLSKFDVVFLLNVRAPGPKAAELARFVEQGGGLFVALGDQVEPEEYAKELAGLLPAALHVAKTAPEGRPARFGEVDVSHPALSVFQGEAREGLLGVRTQRYVLAKPDRPRRRAPRPRELRRRRAGAARGAAREGARPPLHLLGRPRLDRLAHPDELPPGDAAVRGLARGRPRRSPRAGREGRRAAHGAARAGRAAHRARRTGRTRAAAPRARAGGAARRGRRSALRAARAGALAGEAHGGRGGAARAAARLRGRLRSPRVGHPQASPRRAHRLARRRGPREGRGGRAGGGGRPPGAALVDPARHRAGGVLPRRVADRVSGEPQRNVDLALEVDVDVDLNLDLDLDLNLDLDLDVFEWSRSKSKFRTRSRSKTTTTTTTTSTSTSESIA